MATSAQYVLLLSKTRRSELFFLDAGFLLEMTLRRVFKGKGARPQRTRMPTQTVAETDDIRVKIIYNGEMQITYITAGISVDKLREEMRTICGFSQSGPAPDQFTMKWVDDEGDPCRIASQQELDEALRLYELEKDTEITIHGQSQYCKLRLNAKLQEALPKSDALDVDDAFPGRISNGHRF